MRIRGRIFSGVGQGAFFTQLDWVKMQCYEKLKFLPFPGTLNLKVEGEYLDLVKKIRKREGIILEPPTARYCRGRCFPVSIGTIKAVIAVPEGDYFFSKVHSEDVIEIIAPVNLREALSVADGDELVLEVKE